MHPIAAVALGFALVLLLAAAAWAVVGLRRETGWTQVEAIVCDPDPPLARPRPQDVFVMFEGPFGPTVSRLTGTDGPLDGLGIGRRLRIAFDPADPSRIEMVETGGKVLTIALCALMAVALIATAARP